MGRLTVAVLGAGGTMGTAMGRNLLRAGHRVRAWNRTAARLEPLVHDGAEPAATPAKAVANADAVITTLTDADAVVAALDGPDGGLAAMPQGAVWLQMSTIGIEGERRCAQFASMLDLNYVDAPVLGAKPLAEAARLIVLASGATGPRGAAVRERAGTVFDAVSQRTVWLGEAGAGTRMKLVTNAWIGVVVAGGAETLALAEVLGLDPRDFFSIVEGSALDLPYLRLRASAMLAREFPPDFRLSLAAKDSRLAVEGARRADLTLPVVEALSRQLSAATPVHGDEDVAAVYMTVAPARAW